MLWTWSETRMIWDRRHHGVTARGLGSWAAGTRGSRRWRESIVVSFPFEDSFTDPGIMAGSRFHQFGPEMSIDPSFSDRDRIGSNWAGSIAIFWAPIPSIAIR